MASKLDLTHATISELQRIPGVSRALARRIVAAREREGGSLTLDVLRRVTGVTPEVLELLNPPSGPRETAEAEKTQVLGLNLDPERKHAGGYAGYKVTAELIALSTLPGIDERVPVTRAITADASGDGLALLTLPEVAALQSAITFTVRAPDGQVLTRVEKTRSEVRETIALPVAPRSQPTTQPADDPGFNQPTKLRGRVIDRAGRVQIAAKQVVIWTAEKSNPQDADFSAVMAAETDANGYFSGKYPLGKFSSAHATVALDPSQAVVIRLTDAGFLPADVILVVDAPRRMLDQSEGDCGCNGKNGTMRDPDAADLVNGSFSADIGQGKCVDFTRPDRALQEFSYSYVVRTTEPSIKGMTLQEPKRIPPSLLSEIAKLANLSTTGLTAGRSIASRRGEGADAASGLESEFANAAIATRDLELHADLWRKAVTSPEKASATALLEVARRSKYADILQSLQGIVFRPPDRTRLSCANPIDWDDDPTIYQACTVAHGHLLHFKQEWIADGYSMGRLLYSLPLAPGQKKQIAVLDWERRESAVRQESLEETESLQATVSRDRDIGEMVNAVVSESSRGGSSASSGSIAGGIGVGAILGPVGGLIGIGGGSSSADSTAWQDSSRNTSANTLQTLRDRTSQAAAAMRAQRSTVIQTVSQGERVAVTTESVANYNHCHAMTIEYFEVLRHLIVRQRLVDVQECLFVPLQMTRFDRAKALRWRHTLQGLMPTRALQAGFDALERIDNNYVGSDMPLGAYADERLDYVEGELRIRFQLARPRDNEHNDFKPENWLWMG
ncbi:MAG TPA: helix-hairpin-helix domain-containing protein, partial [Chthoniobacterales bacterium]